MNKTATQPMTTFELLTEAQASTTMHSFPDLELLDTSNIPTFTELLAEYQASIDTPEVAWNRLAAVGAQLAPVHDLTSASGTSPFAISQHNLAKAKPQPVRWLWQKRIPLSGITVLDGDHGCCKSLLALRIAACEIA